jgi:hypothetical protein
MVGRVIDGEIAPLTRLDVNRAIPAPDAAAALEEIAARVGRPMVLHSCAAPRWDLIGRLSSYAVSLDVTGIDVADYDPLGGFVDGGGTLIAGVVPTSAPAAPLSADELAGRLLEMTDRIGLPRSVVREHVLVSPTCGLAGAGEWAAPALALSSRIADQLARAD